MRLRKSAPLLYGSAWLLCLGLSVALAGGTSEALPDNQLVATSSVAESGAPRRPPKVDEVWRAAIVARLEQQGRASEAAGFSGSRNPEAWLMARAGDFGVALRRSGEGITLESLFDMEAQVELAATNALPLFEIELRHVTTKAVKVLHAGTGWHRVDARLQRRGLKCRWFEPKDTALAGLIVEANAVADRAEHAWRWTLRVVGCDPAWSVWSVVFPQVAVADLGDGGNVLFPRGPGEVQEGVWRRKFRYQGNYPGGWCTMQFMGAYRGGDRPAGLYLAVSDPYGSTKNLTLESDSPTRSVRFRFEHPAPDMGLGGNGFRLAGEGHWQLLRGDWFDAAEIYRDWVRREARWYPKIRSAGRTDTPEWMRLLNVWALGGGAPEACVSNVLAFRKHLDAPTGFHWYNWHQIPFDNDYPHYFPARTNFARGVRELQEAAVYVMPYINGRLWDSHDRGGIDFDFSRRALPAATKQEDGKPYLESYGSKETNNLPVRLAAMCPATALWQNTVSNIVLALLRDVGTRAVYIDQVAAAAPTLCLDRTHGHPLGGGHWWNEGYWRMLEAIRRAMPPGSVLTTECNGEPFIRWFDGYLTWHWQHDGQVPAFPAVYGGAIQTFGRAYRGGATKDLALRMRAAQQLVFGEQIGWIDPGVVQEKENAAFLRQMVELRARYNRYFQAGEMGRPPRLLGAMPRVKADWQWSGEWWVSTDAVMTGMWKLPKERRMLMLFVNVGDEVIRSTLEFDAARLGVRARQFLLETRKTGRPDAGNIKLSARFERELLLEPRASEAWELRW